MITLSVLKADVGSIGSHSKPSDRMMNLAKEMLNIEIGHRSIISGIAVHTGDDICLIMTHHLGKDNPIIHNFAWNIFKTATEVAQREGLYGAGQDLLVDAPAGNIRGAGPGVVEIDLKDNKERPAEAILIFAADKCGPGAFNLPLYQVFCDPMHNGGLLLSPKLRCGFKMNIIDMEHKEGDKVISLKIPERNWDAAILLRDIDRFGIESIYSEYCPDEQIVGVSTSRLHNIAGKYVGKDDPIAIIRTQGMFPAPEECVEPYLLGHYVTGDARGSHNMPLFPVPINTAVTGAFCLPVISCLAFSVNKDGLLSDYVDMFDNPVWDATRLKVAQKAEEFRRQGFFGITMASKQELAYTGIIESLDKLEQEFKIR